MRTILQTTGVCLLFLLLHPGIAAQNRLQTQLRTAFKFSFSRDSLDENKDRVPMPGELLKTVTLRPAKSSGLKSELIDRENLNPDAQVSSAKPDSSVSYYWYSGTSEWLPQGKTGMKYDVNGFLSSQVMYEWSGINWTAYSTNTYTNDPNGNVKLCLSEDHYSASDQTFRYKQEQAYDADGRVILFGDFSWDFDAKVWTGIAKEEIVRDINGDIILLSRYRWDKLRSDWAGLTKFEYSYDNRRNITLATMQYWDTILNSWTRINATRNEFIYDSRGNQLQYIAAVWYKSDGKWINYMKTENFFSAADKDTLQVTSGWDTTVAAWRYSSMDRIRYSENGKEESHSYYNWAKDQGQWIPATKLEYAYSGNNIRTLIIYSMWDIETGEWVPAYRDLKTLDGNGGLIQDAEFIWNNTVKDWIGASRYDYTLNPDGQISQIMSSDWDTVSGEWVNRGRSNSYYSFHAVTGVEPSTITIYPNPATDFVRFEAPLTGDQTRVEIFDNAGAKVADQSLPYSREISVAKMAGGLYFYKVTCNGKVYKGKIVVAR